MDWREIAGRPTFRLLHGEERWNAFAGAWSGGKKLTEGGAQPGVDPARGWVLGVAWVLASTVECAAIRYVCDCYVSHIRSAYYLYAVVRRPRLILDFSLTLLFNHLVITTYYAAAVPTSLFYWAVVLAGAALTVILGEQLCVRREMTEGLAVVRGSDGDNVEMEGLMQRRD